MSYDIRIGVEVADAGGLIAKIGVPEYDSPTYNLGAMFRKCMDWDYETDKWYRLTEVLPKIRRGYTELCNNESKYRKYNPRNGWGDTESAKKCLASILEEIDSYENGWNQTIPKEYLWISW